MLIKVANQGKEKIKDLTEQRLRPGEIKHTSRMALGIARGRRQKILGEVFPTKAKQENTH